MERTELELPKFGYRDEEFGGSGEHDPVEVCIYELEELDNVDIPMTILNRHGHLLTDDETRLLDKIVRSPTAAIENAGSDVIDAYADIIEKVCDGRDFCLWVCLTPHDYFDAYIDVFDDDTDMRRRRIASVRMSKYAIPADAIVLSDDPDEGLLIAWKADARNTTPVTPKVDFEGFLSPIEREPECFPGTSIPMSRDTVRVQDFNRFGHLAAQLEFAVHMGDDDDIRDWRKISMGELLAQIKKTAIFAIGHTFLIDDNRLGEPTLTSADIDERIDMEQNENDLIRTSLHAKENLRENVATKQPGDSECPFCGGLMDDADTMEMTRHFDKAYAEQSCHCSKCDTEWVDQYVWRRAVRV